MIMKILYSYLHHYCVLCGFGSDEITDFVLTSNGLYCNKCNLKSDEI